jgi:hypothetical protein
MYPVCGAAFCPLCCVTFACSQLSIPAAGDVSRSADWRATPVLCQTTAARHVIAPAAVLIATHMAQARGRPVLTLVTTNWGIKSSLKYICDMSRHSLRGTWSTL